MIGTGLKKFALENGFHLKKGFAYGAFNNYMLTLKEGMGWKSVTYAVNFTDETSKAIIHTMLDNAELKTEYRISGHDVTDAFICVMFFDNPGTMTKIKTFNEMFCEKLISCSVRGIGYCNCCGLELAGPSAESVMINESVCQMHAACIDKIAGESEANKQEVRSTGSVLTGTVGAAVGGLIGAIPWAIAYYFGWFVGWLGFLIGIAAKKGYELFKGKETKAKAIVILAVAVLAVVCVEYITCLVAWMAEISADPELSQMNLTVFDVSNMLVETFLQDAEFRTTIIMDVILGWVFAGLGIFSTLRDIFKTTKKMDGVPIRLNDIE